MQFNIRRIFDKDVKSEIKNAGFSPSYLDLGVLKHRFLNLKISNLKPETATIIKQTALASNCDAAVHKEVLGCKIKLSDVILSGTIAELQTVAEKLKMQQFSLPLVSKEILRQIEISKKPCDTKIMGILNVTPDSFSDGGKFLDPKKAIEHGLMMIEKGAEIIDIGAESTRPNARAVDFKTEAERLAPVLKELRKENILISIDTRSAEIARQMADLGADIINDVSGLDFDKNMAKAVAKTGLKVVITHSRGTPENMDNLAEYEKLIDEVYRELLKKIENALQNGVGADKIIIDPGFGFAKNIEQNFELLSRVREFKSLGFPLLCGVSRKRFLKNLCEDDMSNLAAFYLASQNVDIIRVHDVSGAKNALKMAKKLGLIV